MIRITSYILLSVFLFACKGKKEVASTSPATDRQVLSAKKRLKSVFIEAKKEQVIDNTNNAKVLFAKVLKEDPSCSACAFELANIAIKQKDAGSAESMSALAFKAKPYNPHYRRQRAEVVYMLGNPQKAAQISNVLIDSFPKTRDHYRRTVFYFEKSEQYNEAEVVLNKYKRQFGFTYRTAMMYDYLYKSSNDNVKIEQNWAALVKKYPNDFGYRKKYINTLIDNKKLPEAKAQIEVLSNKLEQPTYAYLLKSKIAAKQKNWKDYLSFLKLADQDKMIEATIKSRYLVKSKEIKDSSILQIVRNISSGEPKAIEFLHFYQEQFGQKASGINLLEEQYKADPSNSKTAKSLYDAYTKNNQWEKAIKVSLELVEDNPSNFEFYMLHAQSLIANGKFADAYAYADQGLVYAIDKDEICAVYTTQALANRYLNKNENVKKDLEKAWGNLGKNVAVKEKLVTVSMLCGLYTEKVTDELNTLDKSYAQTLNTLFKSTSYSKEAWQKLSMLYPQNQLIMEAWVLKAKEQNSASDFKVLKQMLLRKYPAHTFYKNLSL